MVSDDPAGENLRSLHLSNKELDRDTASEMVKRLSQRKAINQVSGEKPLIRCHLSFKRKGVYEKSDYHRDEENRRS
jgi:hypothetical protein